MSELRNYAINCFQDEAQAILDLIPLLTDDFDKAVDLIYHCRGKLVTTGVGKSGNIAAKIAATLASTGTPSFFIDPLNAYHGDLGMISEGDVLLAISSSGQTEEILRLIPLIKERNIPVIAMSGNPESLFVVYSDCYLNISTDKEACPLNLTPTSSTTAALAMGDALACALIGLRNFQKSNFAQFHPGGSLGKRLQQKVKELMISTHIPVVEYYKKISDAITEMGKTNLGVVVVMDNNKIVGVISDMDIRSGIQHYGNDFLAFVTKEAINSSPQIIKETSSRLEAKEMMKKNGVHFLVVTNEQNELVGIIDLLAVS